MSRSYLSRSGSAGVPSGSATVTFPPIASLKTSANRVPNCGSTITARVFERRRAVMISATSRGVGSSPANS